MKTIGIIQLILFSILVNASIALLPNQKAFDLKNWLSEIQTELKKDGDTPLHVAVLQENLEAVSLLLAAGVDVNAFNHIHITPLGYAIGRKNTTELSELLLKNGANPNVKQHMDGFYLLNTAIKISRSTPEVVSLLIKYGADVNVCDILYGTPLHAVARRSIFNDEDASHARKIATSLIKAGAKVDALDACNKENPDKETPLWRSIVGGNFQVTEILLEHGASIKNYPALRPMVRKIDWLYEKYLAGRITLIQAACEVNRVLEEHGLESLKTSSLCLKENDLLLEQESNKEIKEQLNETFQREWKDARNAIDRAFNSKWSVLKYLETCSPAQIVKFSKLSGIFENFMYYSMSLSEVSLKELLDRVQEIAQGDQELLRIALNYEENFLHILPLVSLVRCYHTKHFSGSSSELLDAIKTLLERGASPETKSIRGSAYNTAIEQGNIELVKLFIEKAGIPKDLPDKIFRSISASSNSLELFNLFASYEFSPNELDYLHEAISYARMSIIKILLKKHKVSVLAKGTTGWYSSETALEYARHKIEDKAIIDLIEKRAEEEMLEANRKEVEHNAEETRKQVALQAKEKTSRPKEVVKSPVAKLTSNLIPSKLLAKIKLNNWF